MTKPLPIWNSKAPGFYAVVALVFAASVAATVYFCVSMSGGMDMPGGWTMSMMWMRMPGQTWAGSAAMFLLIWLAMMVAMMLPSALPILLSHRQALYAQSETRVGMPTMMLAGGYFFVWLVIGALVYVAGVIFALATMRSAGLSHAEPVLSGIALVISGCLQFTDWKMCGLRRCRNSQACVALRACRKCQAAWLHGLSQGASCAICCSGPMLTLLALGAMNLTVMAIIAVVIAMEKLMPKPELVVRISGIVAVCSGLVMMVRPLF
jgi:predicted metal-binding membrane protein